MVQCNGLYVINRYLIEKMLEESVIVSSWGEDCYSKGVHSNILKSYCDPLMIFMWEQWERGGGGESKKEEGIKEKQREKEEGRRGKGRGGGGEEAGGSSHIAAEGGRKKSSMIRFNRFDQTITLQSITPSAR